MAVPAKYRVRNNDNNVVGRLPHNLPVGDTSAGQDQDSLLVFLDTIA
jgi:hypothetical protein